MQETVVLGRRADGEAQAALALQHAVTVSHNDAVLHKVVVHPVGISHLDQEEVGIAGVDVQHAGQRGQQGGQPFAFADDFGHVLVVRLLQQAAHHLLLCGSVHVVGIFHPSQHLGHLGRGEGQSEP